MSTELETLLAEARDPDTSFERLVELLESSAVEVGRAILDNPNICPTKTDGKFDTSLFVELAKQFFEEVATHPLFVLHILIEPNEDMALVAMEVVQRTTNVGLIERVFRSWGPSCLPVRGAVAFNPNTPIEILRFLSHPGNNTSDFVMESLAQNPSTPIDILRTLSNPSTEEKWEVRRAVTWNPGIPEELLRAMSQPETEPNWFVRKEAIYSLAQRGLL